MTTQGASAVSDFYRAAIETVRPNLKHWRSVWKKSVLAVTQSTEKQLESIDQGKTDHLADGRVYTLPAPDGERKLGFCEWLSPYKSK